MQEDKAKFNAYNFKKLKKQKESERFSTLPLREKNHISIVLEVSQMQLINEIWRVRKKELKNAVSIYVSS